MPDTGPDNGRAAQAAVQGKAAYRCLDCGHEWLSEPVPADCPRCGHPYVQWLNYCARKR